MPYHSLLDFVKKLESEGELLRVKEFVSPHLEITEITDRIMKTGGKVLLFENNGTEFPVLINAFGSEKRMCMALGWRNLKEVSGSFASLLNNLKQPRETIIEKLGMLPLLNRISSWMPRVISGKGACQEVVMEVADITRLPILTCWPEDGGSFVTLPVVHTRDPESGTRNVGMYRMQVFGTDLTGMHWHLHKGSARHFEKYRELGEKMPVTVTLGGDPVYTYVATAPVPEDFDEYLLAGFIRRKRVEMVKCLTNNLVIPSDVDFVIEGYVDPKEEMILEGPFGDHTGFYSLADYYPKFHITCITHRKSAIYPATIVGIPPMEDGWIGRATEQLSLDPLRMTIVPEIVNLHMPVEGVFHNIALVSINKNFPGQGIKVMNALWGAGQMMFNKVMILVDKGTDIYNYLEVARAVSENVDPQQDIHFIKGPVDILDHSSQKFAFGSKIGIDATSKPGKEMQSNLVTKKESFADKDLLRKEFAEIRNINASLPDIGVSALIISIGRMDNLLIRKMCKEMVEKNRIRGYRFVFLMDYPTDIFNLHDVAWICGNNIDPLRDCFLISPESTGCKILFIDGTRKQKTQGRFEREWPNVIIMNDETIDKIDKKWEALGLGRMIPSPSLKYKPLHLSGGAVIKQND
ncbi:MAG: menaquinone biosynthesis decarboxylase [Bacteroidetes bacterium]|nr:menaquinone biosynthesis decarboxylase [Bacteroidota bacterium]